jgi:hypothetical protein
MTTQDLDYLRALVSEQLGLEDLERILGNESLDIEEEELKRILLDSGLIEELSEKLYVKAIDQLRKPVKIVLPTSEAQELTSEENEEFKRMLPNDQAFIKFKRGVKYLNLHVIEARDIMIQQRVHYSNAGCNEHNSRSPLLQWSKMVNEGWLFPEYGQI